MRYRVSTFENGVITASTLVGDGDLRHLGTMVRAGIALDATLITIARADAP